MEFTDSQWSTIAHGLDVAAKQYQRDAELMRQLGRESKFGKTESHERLAKQFDQQVVEAVALANLIRDTKGV